MKNLQSNNESASDKLASLHESLREQQQANALAAAHAAVAAQNSQNQQNSQNARPPNSSALPFNFSAASLLLGANPLYSQMQGQNSQVFSQKMK